MTVVQSIFPGSLAGIEARGGGMPNEMSLSELIVLLQEHEVVLSAPKRQMAWDNGRWRVWAIEPDDGESYRGDEVGFVAAVRTLLRLKGESSYSVKGVWWVMKKTVKAYIVGSMGRETNEKFLYRICTDERILGCDVEISWDKPDPKHDCGKIHCSYRIGHDADGWIITTSGGNFIAGIQACPFCGEKLS